MRRSFFPRLRSFTLIELLVVMGVIAILSAITLGAAGYVNRKAASSRAQAEIAAMEAGLERYKVDNGIYPTTTNVISSTGSGTGKIYVGTPGSYSNNATVLYAALAGKTTYTSIATNPIYMEFKPGQLFTNTSPNYVQDPFGYPYGYVCDTLGGTTNVIFNVGFFDLWSTGGLTGTGTGNATNTGQWLTNWKGS